MLVLIMKIKGNHLEKVMCPLFIVGTKVVPEEEVQHRLKNNYYLIITDIKKCLLS